MSRERGAGHVCVGVRGTRCPPTLTSVGGVNGTKLMCGVGVFLTNGTKTCFFSNGGYLNIRKMLCMSRTLLPYTYNTHIHTI